MDANVSLPKLTPVLIRRPSSQPSPEQPLDPFPSIHRSRSALPEGPHDTIPHIVEPKPDISSFHVPEFLNSRSLLNPVITSLGGNSTNTRTAPSTPKIRPRSRSSTPKPGYTDLAPAMQKSPEMGGPLNVTHALMYLEAVKVQFQDKPDVYNHFLDIMRDFKSQVTDTPGVIERVSMLFHGNPGLIQGFNTFLPFGYRIDISADPHDPNTITVTTPMGTTSQSTASFGASRHANGTGFGPSNAPHPPPYGAGIPPLTSNSRPITPMTFQLPHIQQPFDATYSPSLQGQSTTAAASFLGNLNNQSLVEQQPPQGQFREAIQYLNKIKARYSDDPNKYKQFLEILQTYQKEQRHLHDSQVYAQVQDLFKDAQDLLSEFKNFLPDAGVIPRAGQGISQHQGSHGSSWAQDMSVSADKPSKRVSSGARRRKRQAEKDITPAPPVRIAPNRAKKTKHHHRTEGQSPPFSAYQRQLSPDDRSHVQVHPPQPSHSQQHHSRSTHVTHTSHHALGHSPSDELLFFDRAKKALENREHYDEFLKLLSMFSKDIIDAPVLIQMVETFFGDGELMVEFRDLMGLDDRSDIEYGGRSGLSEAVCALPVDDGEGPSYRRLPESERNLACSGRDQLCRSVLNNEWISHPAWATEEAGFVTHKKNSFEEVLHKCEEERHEYHVQLDALTRTIAILEPLNARLDDMSADERGQFRLRADFGGPSKCIYHRIIKKVYGRDAGLEIIRALQDCPSVAVPVVLGRLKQKDYEWRRAQREWSRTWREVDAKNFYKSLDHQGISFKANDKKNITAKHFTAEIEAVKAEQPKAGRVASHFHAWVGFQLEFSFHNSSVLHDSLRLVYSFLDRSQLQYSPQERRSVERFLGPFISLLGICPAAEFNAACGSLDGVHDDTESTGMEGQRSGRRSTGGVHSGGVVASVLRKKLLRTVLEKSGRMEGVLSTDESGKATPNGRSPRPTNVDDSDKHSNMPDDVWVRETLTSVSKHQDDHKSTPNRRPLFINTTFYTLLRLLQLLYSRLLMCKEIGEKLAAEKHVSFLENPIAVELGLDDPNGPSAVLGQAMAAMGDQRAAESANVTYTYLLDACEKVFDNELDQATFEEHMRWFFGNKAFHVFTLDKLIMALIKQVQTIQSDHKCQEFWFLMQQVRNLEKLGNQDTIRYRREAEGIVGVEDPMYKIEWEPESKVVRIQLLGENDPSVDGDGSTLSRWQEYVNTYVMQHQTEWLPVDGREIKRIPVYSKRNAEAQTPPPLMESNVGIRISFGTYKLFYEAGSEDFLWRKWGKDEAEKLSDRARGREDERRRSALIR